LIYRHPSFAGRIGIARRDITPPVGIRHRNWGAQTHDVAEGVHRPLTATVMTFQTERSEPPVVLVSLDLGWWRTPRDELAVRRPVIETLGLPEANLLICLSHTHAGPTTHLGDANLPGGELVAPYLADVAKTVIAATEEALKAAAPSVLETTVTTCDLAHLRDVPEPGSARYIVGFDGSSQPRRELAVGRITRASGEIVGTLLHYACHPTSLGWENRLISPDYVGAAREVLEAETNSPCLFLQGWSGDLAPRDQYAGDTRQADVNGRRVGLAALSALIGMLPPRVELHHGEVVESGAPLQVVRRAVREPAGAITAKSLAVPVPIKPMPSLAELEGMIADATGTYEIERLLRKRQVRQSVGNGFRVPVYVVRLGEIAIAGVPGEMVSGWNQAIRGPDVQVHALGVNLVNGWYGYLPERHEYSRDQYSVWQTPFDAGAYEQVVDAISQELPTTEPYFG